MGISVESTEWLLLHCFQFEFSLKCQPSPPPNPQGALSPAPPVACGLGEGDGLHFRQVRIGIWKCWFLRREENRITR